MTNREAPDLTPQARHALERRHVFQRSVELLLTPVAGDFDAAHLREINRRLFQDLPALGFDDVTPGQYRPAVPDGLDWIKNRRLETVDAPSCVAYSRMDDIALARMDHMLAEARPATLSRLPLAKFVRALGNLYAELDYAHPFRDGNSRSLRIFTRQLAQACGYSLDWERFNRSPGARDLLYIARDRSVNALALPDIRHAGTRRDVVLTMDRFEGNPDLPELLRDAVSAAS